MTHTSHPIRPARAAIAAVLALTATPLMAQDLGTVPGTAPATVPVLPQPQASQPAGPVAPPVPGAPAAAPTAPAQPPATSLPGAPLASPVIPPTVTDVPVAAMAPSAAAESPPARQATRAPTERAQTESARQEPVARQTERETVPAASGADTATDDILTAEEASTLPPMPSGRPLAEASPADATPAATPAANGDGEIWGWMAALLAALGLGGGAIALSRTRTRDAASVSGEGQPQPVEPRPAAPLGRPQPPMQMPGIAPVASAPGRPAVHPPGMLAGRDALLARDARPHDQVDRRRLEYLIAQRPSRDNPFLTRPHRKRRALFLMRHGYGMQNAA